MFAVPLLVRYANVWCGWAVPSPNFPVSFSKPFYSFSRFFECEALTSQPETSEQPGRALRDDPEREPAEDFEEPPPPGREGLGFRV